MTHTRATVAAAYACASCAPWRIMPRHSRSLPGWKPGVSTNVTIGRLNASHHCTNRAAFCEPSMSRVPAMRTGWLATTPTARPSSRPTPVTPATAAGPVTYANASLVITTTSARPRSSDGPDTQGPVTTSTTGTIPDASPSARATRPQACSELMPSTTSAPELDSTPTT